MKKSSCRPSFGPGSVTQPRAQRIDAPPGDKIHGLACLSPPGLFGRGTPVTPGASQVSYDD
jgi:hypothetical protein